MYPLCTQFDEKIRKKDLARGCMVKNWHLFTIAVILHPTVTAEKLCAFSPTVKIQFLVNVVLEIALSNEFLWLIYCTKTEQRVCHCRIRLCQIGGEGPNSSTGWIFLQELLLISVVTTQTMKKTQITKVKYRAIWPSDTWLLGYQTHGFYSLALRKKSKCKSKSHAQRRFPRREGCAAHVLRCSFSKPLPGSAPFWLLWSPVAPVCSV